MRVVIALLFSMLPGIACATGWTFEAQTDAFTDRSDYRSGTRSTTSPDGFLGFNCIGKLQAIVLRIGAHADALPTRVRTFRYRIDQGPIEEISDVMTSGSFVITQGGEAFSKLLAGLRNGSVLVAELSDYRETSVRHVFSLEGSTAAIAKVVSACSR